MKNAILQRLNKFKERRVKIDKERDYFRIGSRVDNLDKDQMVYFDEKMQELMETVDENIESDFILYGPSGAGKGAISKEIHRRFAKHCGQLIKEIPFYDVDCTSLKNETMLFDNKLYGHVKGGIYWC
jgi:transcriptional regulator with AAA-type ATPase domain